MGNAQALKTKNKTKQHWQQLNNAKKKNNNKKREQTTKNESNRNEIERKWKIAKLIQSFDYIIIKRTTESMSGNQRLNETKERE